MKFRHKALRDDKEIVLEAVMQNKSYRNLIPEAVTQDCMTLMYVAEELTRDRVFVREAVKQWGRAPEYAT